MKLALIIVVLVASAYAAPAPQQDPNNSPLAQLLQDAILEPATKDEALARSIRQTDISNQSPLSQLLYDILQIPQMALQAVSRLLTNPGNTIGQSFSFANTKTPAQQQQTPNLI